MTDTCTTTSLLGLVKHWFAINICQTFISRFLCRLVNGSSEFLTVKFPSSDEVYFGAKESNNNVVTKEGRVTLYVRDPTQMAWRMLLDPKLGLGEAYMDGAWDATPNPKLFLNLLIRAKRQSSAGRSRRTTLSGKVQKGLVDYVLGAIRGIAGVINYMRHRLRANTVGQSAKNIEEHYDLGNNIFELFLDNTMTYSCAIFKDTENYEKECLAEAQLRKIDTLLDQLDIKPSDHILEIGCGWGTCGIRAVQRFGCKWTGLTISHEQLEWAKNKVKEAGLEDKVDFKFQDYRNEKGLYDKVVSIEMIEAVGEEFLKEYFQVINDRLRANGKAAIQGIICPDAYYQNYCKSSDFIKKYIFPGGHMPSRGAIKKNLPDNLLFEERKSFSMHYSKTLDVWFNNWISKKEELRKIGVTERFHRKWIYYFNLCSALFEHEHIDVIHFTLNKQ